MTERNVGAFPRPKENATGNYIQIPLECIIHKITKGKGSHKCDLYKTLRIKENHFTSAHIEAHHRCWRLIHGELARLASTEWRFMCISGEKTLETIWKELTEEFEEELK